MRGTWAKDQASSSQGGSHTSRHFRATEGTWKSSPVVELGVKYDIGPFVCNPIWWQGAQWVDADAFEWNIGGRANGSYSFVSQ